MLRSIGLPELLVVLVVGILFLVPAIFFLITLQRALERCAPESRAMSPGTVWLWLIPLFSLVWQFPMVINIAKSLHNEFVRRNLPVSEPEPGKSLGLAMCILWIVGIVPVIGIVAGLAGMVCWILYWVKITEYSRMLKEPSAAALIV
jgi:hypothetical protein